MSPTYTGEVRVGWEDQSLMRVLFDTGSDWLVIPSSECDNCGTRTTRDNTISATKVVEKYSPEQLVYGSATLDGGVWEDKVCLNGAATSCVLDFKYFSFWSQNGLPAGTDGIMGLAQNRQMLLSTSERAVGDLFVRQLALSDNIP